MLGYQAATLLADAPGDVNGDGRADVLFVPESESGPVSVTLAQVTNTWSLGNYGFFYMYNQTKHAVIELAEYQPGSTSNPSQTAEWVMEAPSTSSPVLRALAVYSGATMLNPLAEDYSGGVHSATGPATDTQTTIDLVQSSTNDTMSTAAASGSEITYTYVNQY